MRNILQEQRESDARIREELNPNDCKCGRTWYPRYKDPLSKRFEKTCPGCHRSVHTCTC